ncbi:MAG TPA: prolyl oligopeptidase family serine peptidase [Streptosporangiaceae bacterium]|jgi:dipeptidyl aminopeptidase/acylaminoacyl peptidase|nr:prolyl oligopeptidase family serine peptidase [Streptosporangiaceae bacterium]
MSTEHDPAVARPSGDVLTRPARPPDLVLRYGEGSDQVADVHMPPPEPGWGSAARGERARLAVFLHGGYWRAQYDRRHTAPLAEALAAAGFIVCAPEYRRTGRGRGGGGGWPETFDDVAAAMDRLPGLVAEAADGLVDGRSMVLAGHSAGGHLALWAASRHRLPGGSPWRAEPRPGCGVVALAAVSDLTECQRLRLGGRAADALIGGGPKRFPERYEAADPARLLPVGSRVLLVHGTADDRVPPEMSVGYAAEARAAGDTEVDCVLLPGAGHFDLIDPLSGAWPSVLAAFRSAHPPVQRTAP